MIPVLPADLLAIAEQFRYSDGVLRIVPLPSGHWAIYGHAASVRVIEKLDEEQLRTLSNQSAAYGKQQKARWLEAKQNAYVANSGKTNSKLTNELTQSAEDLGL